MLLCMDVCGFAYVHVYVWTYEHTCASVCMQCMCLYTVCDLSSVCRHYKCLCVWVHTGGGMSTQNHVRAVTSRAEIGLVSPMIRQRGEIGKRRKLEERKGLFHHHYLPLHLHNNFISNSGHWMYNRTTMPLWSQLKLMEYLYADCRTLTFLSFPNSMQPSSTVLISFVLDLPLLGFDTIFTPPRALYSIGFSWKGL